MEGKRFVVCETGKLTLLTEYKTGQSEWREISRSPRQACSLSNVFSFSCSSFLLVTFSGQRGKKKMAI
jgi:hypothetical protein